MQLLYTGMGFLACFKFSQSVTLEQKWNQNDMEVETFMETGERDCYCLDTVNQIHDSTCLVSTNTKKMNHGLDSQFLGSRKSMYEFECKCDKELKRSSLLILSGTPLKKWLRLYGGCYKTTGNRLTLDHHSHFFKHYFSIFISQFTNFSINFIQLQLFIILIIYVQSTSTCQNISRFWMSNSLKISMC